MIVSERAWSSALAWGCVLLLAVLSLAPISSQQRTGAGAQLEHIFAYAVTTWLFCAAWRPRLIAVIGTMLLLAAGLEAAQLLTPFRQASIHDFVWSAAGVLVGAGTWAVVDRLRRRLRP